MEAQQQKLVPELRFPEFEGEWFEKKLSDIFTFKNGVNASKEDYGEGYKFINVLDIIQNDYITHEKIRGSVNISEVEFKKYIVEYGDILFQRSSETRKEVGQANAYVDKEHPATFGGFVIRGKKKAIYDPFFMNALLKTSRSRKEITSKSGGSTRYNVGQETLSGVLIFTTKGDEQRKIADFLSSVDERIQLLQQKKEKLQAYKKGVMQQLFSPVDGRGPAKDEINPRLRFKHDDGSDFPDWQQKKLGEVLEYEQPTKYLVSDTEYKDEYRTPVLTAGKTFLLGYTNETEGIFKDNLPTIIFDDFTTAFQYVDFPFKAKSSAMKMLIPKKGELIRYIYEVMKTIRFPLAEHKRYWISEFQKEKIPYPTLPEQRKIADFLSAIDEQIEQVGQQIEKTQLFKKGLLQKMFV